MPAPATPAEPTPPTHASAGPRWLTAWLSAALLSALGYLALLTAGVLYPLQQLFGIVTQFLGVPWVFQLIHRLFGLGDAGKNAAFVAVAVAWLLGLTLLGLLSPLMGALGLGLALALFVPWYVALGYAVAYGLIRLLLAALLRPLEAGNTDRRALVAALGGGSALLVGAGIVNLFRSAAPAQPTPATVAADGTLPFGVTPVEHFYYVSKNLEGFDPVLNEADWTLTVDGLVQQPGTFRLADLRARPRVAAELTLSCISNTVGGPLISNGLWTGFSLAGLLAQVGVQKGAKFLLWEAADGYTESLPLGQAMAPDVLLVYALNGQPLNPKHGFPLRVLIPGRYGMKQPRWITRITLSAEDRPGYWVQRDWSKTALVRLMSRIDLPASGGPSLTAGQPTAIRGIAFYGGQPVTKVEVSTDGGKTWRAATLEPQRSKQAWTLWSLPWTPEAGSFELVARAYSGTEMQAEARSGPLPEGATGWHRFAVGAS